MNESALPGGMLAQELQRDLEDLDLFREALVKMKEDAATASDASLLLGDKPRLTLVLPDDHEEAPSQAPSGHEGSAPGSDVDDGDFGELWLESLTDEHSHTEKIISGSSAPAACEEPTCLAPAQPPCEASPASVASHELSEVEDVLLSNPLQQISADEIGLSENGGQSEMDAEIELVPLQAAIAAVPASKPASVLGVQRPAAPQRIGSGKLAPTKLHWKPGDPFGCSDEVRGRFRWEIMLTTACVTAICGLTCIWLLRTILA